MSSNTFNNTTDIPPTTQASQKCSEQSSQTPCHPTAWPHAQVQHRARKIKTIKARRFNTQWMPKVTTKIITNPDDAIEVIQNDNPDVKVFTDGSRMEGWIGASMVLYRNGRLQTTLWHQLGSMSTYCIWGRRSWHPTRDKTDKQQVGNTVSQHLYWQPSLYYCNHTDKTICRLLHIQCLPQQHHGTTEKTQA